MPYHVLVRFAIFALLIFTTMGVTTTFAQTDAARQTIAVTYPLDESVEVNSEGRIGFVEASNGRNYSLVKRTEYFFRFVCFDRHVFSNLHLFANRNNEFCTNIVHSCLRSAANSKRPS